MKNRFNIGTCSWKYDSWRGLIYPEHGPVNYLREYSYYYNTVEIDQWFWSLFKENKVVLPKPEVAGEYANSVPEDFTFCIKVPNSITLTHYYNKDKKAPLQPNPYFLSIDLFQRFLDSIQPLSGHIGPLIFQFEYLNKKKMEGKEAFFEQFHSFAEKLPEGFEYCLESRNPNYLGAEYFDFLSTCNLHHVFLHGYYMEPVFDLYEKYRQQIQNLTVIRLHGPDRQNIEKQTGKKWNQIVSPRDGDLERLKLMLDDLKGRYIKSFVFVNNHFEGSAPRTISRINELLTEG
jgi:uncharacterized protein YecE (DUF72 family)